MRQFENMRKKAHSYEQSLEEENQKLANENEDLTQQLSTAKVQLQESRELADGLQSEMEQALTQMDISNVTAKDEREIFYILYFKFDTVVQSGIERSGKLLSVG